MTVNRLVNGARGRLRVYCEQSLSRARSTSERVVNCPPEGGIGLGNMLYFLLWAHAGRRYGRDWSVRSTPALARWCETFPATADLLVQPEQVNFLDARVQDWSQDFTKFSPSILPTFVRERLLTAPRLTALIDPQPSTVVTVNVRRGDYYSVPEFRARYGFDVAAYVRKAMTATAEQGEVSRIRVISDDPKWCQAHLGFLDEYGRVSFPAGGPDPIRDLAALASGRRLILANSSFSYWGGFLSNEVHEDNHSEIWSPNFHERGINGGLPYQVDPRWSRVMDMPDGWAEAF